MVNRFRFLAITFAPRRDVLLMTAATIAVFVITAVWGVLLAGRIDPFRSQNVSKYFLTFLFFAAAGGVAAFPYLSKWDQQAGHAVARAVVRFGIALQLFAVFASLVGLFYATDPTRAVPVGFATFAAMLVGLLAAGFAANSFAPDKA